MATAIAPVMAPAVNLLKRLSFAKKFILIGLVFALPLLVLSGVLYHERSTSIEQARREHQGLERISTMRALLEQIGQARSRVAEASDAEPGHAALRAAITKSFQRLTDLEADAGVARSRAVARGWQQLQAIAVEKGLLPTG